MFNVPSVFYGKRIRPGTFRITDSDISGSDGRVSITLRDDGRGNLYRADSKSSHAKWSSVGNIFYNEGVVIVKTPNIPFFGKRYFDVEFNGEKSVHVMKIHAPCPAGQVNSSSNPAFSPVSASLNANDPDSRFVYITNVVFHDKNLNVVARTNLAQPIVKRDSDKFLFKVKIDF